MPCPDCGRGFHDDCEEGCETCHPVAETSSAEKVLTGKGQVGRPLKEPNDMKDESSTGRKRAAIWYPIFADQPCEWRGKKNCGGGLKPVIGCLDGFQEERQHGPVKDTRHNNPENIHRICKKCHRRWHVLNDPVYDEELYKTLPHQPEPATHWELTANEVWWQNGRKTDHPLQEM